MGSHRDRRSEAQRKADQRRLHQQIERLRDKRRAHDYQRALLQEISCRPGAGGRQFALQRIDRGADFLVAVRGEILVKTSQLGEVARVPQAAAFTQIDVPEIDFLVTRLARADASLTQVRSVVAALEAAGVRASVNYVLPLGYIVKGEGGFENTTVSDDQGPGDALPSGPKIAVVDTGVAAKQRADGWLQTIPRGIGSTDPLYQAGSAELLDFAAGHGTFVAGIVQQLAPTADIRSYAAVNSDGIGSEVAVAAAVLRAARAGTKIINMSLGTEVEGESPPVALEVVLDALVAEQSDALIVAAAGNNGTMDKSYPAGFDGVIGVGSLATDMTGSIFSNHGDWVHCSTIGEGVVSTFVEGLEDPAVDKDGPDRFGVDAWALGTGTSFAAPQITGAVAEAMVTDPTLSPRAALDVVLAGAVPLQDFGLTVGLLEGTPSQ